MKKPVKSDSVKISKDRKGRWKITFIGRPLVEIAYNTSGHPEGVFLRMKLGFVVRDPDSLGAKIKQMGLACMPRTQKIIIPLLALLFSLSSLTASAINYNEPEPTLYWTIATLPPAPRVAHKPWYDYPVPMTFDYSVFKQDKPDPYQEYITTHGMAYQEPGKRRSTPDDSLTWPMVGLVGVLGLTIVSMLLIRAGNVRRQS